MDEVPAHWLEVFEESLWHNLLLYLPGFHFPRQESVNPSAWIYFCFQSQHDYFVRVVLSVVFFGSA